MLGVAGRAGDTFTVVMAGVRIGLDVLQIFGFFSNGCIALMAGSAGFVVRCDELLSTDCIFFSVAGCAVLDVLVVGLYLLSRGRKSDK